MSKQFPQDFSAHSAWPRDPGEVTILNADGLYLTSYRVLHLNIKLRMEGHYHRPEDERYPSISGITDNKEQVVVACMLLFLVIDKLAPVF